MNMIRKALVLLMALVFLIGLSIYAYPIVNGAIVDKEIQENADEFINKQDQPSPEQEESYVIHSDRDELWLAMTEYNQTIWEQRQSGLSDPWSYEQPSFALEQYGIADEVFGVISIPKIELEMPIYLGATEAHMSAGAAHLSQTSLPIGGTNTNCVIAGHRGYRGAAYFTYVDRLQVGDPVTITNLWETLEYQVCEIRIIEPNDVKAIHIQEGRDLITLLTCHPYASGGKQRMAIYCERITAEKEAE